MNTITTSVNFTSDYGKPIEMNVSRDKWGDFSINWIQVGKSHYSGKQIRTARREAILIQYAFQYIDLHEYLADEIYDRETNHFID
jgi:hypothetical protein